MPPPKEVVLTIIIKKEGLNIEIRKQTTNILISMTNHIKIDVVNYPYKWTDTFVSEDNVVLASVKDIATMKLQGFDHLFDKKYHFEINYYKI